MRKNKIYSSSAKFAGCVAPVRQYNRLTANGEIKTKPSENNASAGCSGCVVPNCPAQVAGCAAPVSQVERAEGNAHVNPTTRFPAGVSGGEVTVCPAGKKHCSENEDKQLRESFSPFITDGFISLVGDSDQRKPVKILRDTGATESFVSETALPFSPCSSTGKSVLIHGIGLQTMSAPNRIRF